MPLLIAALSALFGALGLFEVATPPAADPAKDDKKPEGAAAGGQAPPAVKTDEKTDGGKPASGGQEPPAQKGTTLADPEKLQRELNDARKDAGKYRSAATESLVALAKAMGLELPTDKGKVDPEQAVVALQKRIDDMQAESRSDKLATAFERAAAAAGAKPTLTRRYLDGADAFKDLDPKAADFQAKVNEIVQAAVTEEPALKAEVQVTPRRSGGEFTGQPDKSLDEKIAVAEKGRDFKESIRLKQEQAARARR